MHRLTVLHILTCVLVPVVLFVYTQSACVGQEACGHYCLKDEQGGSVNAGCMKQTSFQEEHGHAEWPLLPSQLIC
jgi:hypothetical protein